RRRRPGTPRGRARAARRRESRPLCARAVRRRARAAGRARTPPWRAGRARRARGAAGRTRRRRARRSRELELLVPHLDRRALARAGGLQRALELFVRRWCAQHAVAAFDTQQAPGPRLRLGAIHEVVRELVRPLVHLRLGNEREEAALEVVHTFAGCTGQTEDGDDALVFDREDRVRLEIDLVQDDDLRTLVEPRTVRAELGVDRPPLLVRRLRSVDHVHEGARTLEVRKELVTEPDAFARALDQAWNISDDELPPVGRLDRP